MRDADSGADELEKIERRLAASEDVAELAREVFLRMARLSPGAGVGNFLAELVDSGIDADTQELFAEVACDRDFLLALDDYVFRTSLLH